MSELKRVHKGLSGMYVTHYAECDTWSGYFCQTGCGKMFTDSKHDGEKWDEGYLFNIHDHTDLITITRLED